MQKKEIIGCVMGCITLLSASHITYGMMSTIRSKFSAANLAIRSIPQRLSARYYSMYRTPASQRSLQQKQKPVTPPSMPQMQQRTFHTTPPPRFSTSRPSYMSAIENFARWATGKPTASTMFTLFDQALKDGSGFDQLMSNVASGAYDDIINTTRSGKFFADIKDRTTEPSQQLTILDQCFSHLIKADRFGPRFYVNGHNHPNLTAADFFDIRITPKLIQLIDVLLQRKAVTTTDLNTIFYQIASYYGLIEKGILPPQNTPAKQAFFEYLASLKRFAKYIYDAYKVYSKTPFEEVFTSDNEFHYSSQERHNWIKGRADQIIVDINTGKYQAIFEAIKNGTVDDVIDYVYVSGYFFAGPYYGPLGHYTSDSALGLFERVLQILMKTKALESPMDLQTKEWRDIFNPIKDPQLIPIAKALAEKSMIYKGAEKRVEELVAYVLLAEKFIIPPTDITIAQQYKQFLQAIKDIAQRIFEKQVRYKRSDFYRGDDDDKFEERINAYKMSFHSFTERVKQQYNIASSSQHHYEQARQQSQSHERARQQSRPVSSSKRAMALTELGFSSDASPTEGEIIRKHKELIMQYHPDVLQGKSEQEKQEGLKRSQRINAARDTLLYQ